MQPRQRRDLRRDHQRQQQQEAENLSAGQVGHGDGDGEGTAETDREHGTEESRVERVSHRPQGGRLGEAFGECTEIDFATRRDGGDDEPDHRQQAEQCDHQQHR